jgi:hypothetical protein
MRLILAVAVGLVAGCGGDARDSFEGYYRGASTVFVTDTSGESRASANVAFTIAKSDRRSNALVLWSDCVLTATVADDTSFRIEPASCPEFSVRFANGVICSASQRIQTGLGVMSGDLLNGSYEGTFDVRSCSDNSGTRTARFSAALQMARPAEPAP